MFVVGRVTAAKCVVLVGVCRPCHIKNCSMSLCV